MIILCDLDSIVVDLITPWLEWMKTTHGVDAKLGDIINYDWHKNEKFKSVGVHCYDFLQQPRLFQKLNPLPGALDGIRALREAGHTVLFATAAARSPDAASDKLTWLNDHLGVSRKDVFICHRKERIRADLFIDDSPDNILAYRQAWPKSKIVTIAYPYNQAVFGSVDLVAVDCYHTDKAWKQLQHVINSDFTGKGVT
jgi:5'(3')-deoxyribonucleotidase